MAGLFVAALGLSLSSGCGGGGAGTCGGFTPCGGNVVGDWTITESCLDSTSSADPDCPGATSSFSNFQVQGSMNLAANMTYTSSISFSGSASVSLPNSCLMRPGVTFTCEQLNSLYGLILADPTSPVSAASCRAAGTNCACAFTFRPTPTPTIDTGTYRTSGTTLTTTPSGEAPSSNDYCVAGNHMNVKSKVMAMAGMGAMSMPSSSLGLTRK
ncbi:MAG: hypothetical protein H7X95_05475 [Deltaproteobacteria bacterium]|nr:hypothetical protein [Deltaproteobacteria bacterium]